MATTWQVEASEGVNPRGLHLHSSRSRDDHRIIIIGAGLAGCAAAAVLGKQGLPVTLVDPRSKCPPVFKAEKLEPDQAKLLRKLHLFEPFLARAGQIHEIRRYFNGNLFKATSAEQYGLFYSDMVEALRTQLPKSVEFKRDRAIAIHNSANEQRVCLASGEELKGRLVVIATGLNADLLSSLGFNRIILKPHHSAAIALTLVRQDGQQFPFDAVTYCSTGWAPSVDYLSIFRLGSTMRANLFAFPRPNDPWVRRFIQSPADELARCFPKLRGAIGDYQIKGRVESSLVHLYRTEGCAPGVVMIGDAAQNACPSTGMGLSKVLTDVDILCSNYLPAWLQSPGMGTNKLAAFSNDPVKLAVDTEALRTAIYRRQACTERGLKWRIHRSRLHWTMQFGSSTRRSWTTGGM